MPLQFKGVVMPTEIAISLAAMYPNEINVSQEGGGLYWNDYRYTDQNRRRFVQSLTNSGIKHLHLMVIRSERQGAWLWLVSESLYQEYNGSDGVYRGATKEDLEHLFTTHGTFPVVGHDGLCLYCTKTGKSTVGLRRKHDGDYVCLRCITNYTRHGSWAACRSCGKEWMATMWGNQAFCDQCTPDCASCGQTIPLEELEEDRARFDSGSGLWYDMNCWEDIYTNCHRCGRWTVREITPNNPGGTVYDDDLGAYYCASCGVIAQQEGRKLPKIITSACLVDPVVEVKEDGIPFGVEIEAHFDGNAIKLGGYHSRREADPPFFSRWRAETDGSIYNGGEIISPILEGPKGVAEVLATMNTLRELEASVTGACGQHIHVGSDVEILPLQASASYLEDLMLAITGSFRRWGNGYAPRMKAGADHLRYLMENNPNVGQWSPATELMSGRPLAGRTDHGTIEFRYPPGTLNGTQFVLNHAIVHFVTKEAQKFSPDELTEMLKTSTAFARKSLESGLIDGVCNTGGGPWVHDSIMEAARHMRDNAGWKTGGDWGGFVYAPGTKKKVTVIDEKREIKREISLPSENDLVARLHRQLTNFYVSAHRVGGWWSEKEGRDKAEQVVKVFV